MVIWIRSFDHIQNDYPRCHLSFDLELAAYLKQVCRERDNILYLLDHIQVNHAYLRTARLTLNAFQLTLLQGNQLVIQFGRLINQIIKTCVSILVDHISTTVDEADHHFRLTTKLLNLNLAQGIKVIIDMVLTRLRQTAQAKDNLTREVVALVIIEPLLDSDVVVQLRHAQRADALHLPA